MHWDDGPGGGWLRVPGVPGSGAASAASTVMPGCHRQAQGSRSAVSERLVCPGARVPLLRLALPLSKRPGAHRFWVSFIDGSGFELQLDILAINVRLIYELLRRGVWTIPVFLHAQGVDRALPGEGPVMGAAWQRSPQHFPVCTQARRRFTQVVHMVVHSKPVRVLLAGWQAAAGQRAGACVTQPAHRTRIWPAPG